MEIADALQDLIDREVGWIRTELEAGEIEFALRLVPDLLTHVRALLGDAPVPALEPPATTGDSRFDTLVIAGIRWAMNSDADRPWSAPEPLPTPWYPYDFRSVTEAWLVLSKRETPAELARAGIIFREGGLLST
ncbi:hypothetical protein [Paeniglutamicibacter sp.]|uniref:hypothetical protein n=1 Tax=Paeniglutamicibacter sp. TaxID=1934391 RepID=UPI0039897CC4